MISMLDSAKTNNIQLSCYICVALPLLLANENLNTLLSLGHLFSHLISRQSLAQLFCNTQFS